MSAGLRPENFINGGKKHMILFYEESGYARNIIYQYIKNGLVNGESCIYATEENPEQIEKSMLDFEIDVDRHKKEDRLHFYQMEPFTDFEDTVKEGKKRISRILADSKPPYRVFSRIVPEIDTIRGIKAEIENEHEFHSEFESFDGTYLCSYPIKKIESGNRKQWMQELIQNHHSVILAPASRTGYAYDRQQ